MFEGVGGGVPTALGRIDVGACYTRGARSRRWWGWGGGGVNWSYGMGVYKENEMKSTAL